MKILFINAVLLDLLVQLQGRPPVVVTYFMIKM